MINLKAIWQLAGYSIVIGAVIGAVVGAGLGAWEGSRFFGRSAVLVGLFLGTLLGATTGLDIVLDPPKFVGYREVQGKAPFTWATICILGGVGALLMALYSWDPISLLRIENNSLWFFPIIFAVAGIVLLYFSIPAFRSAQQTLRKKLNKGKARSKQQK